MKKIIYSTMIASLLAFVGCQNEELVNDNNTDNSGKKVILTANIQGAADSRVALTPETSNGATTVKVDWRNSGEKEVFQVVWVSSNGFSAPTTFTQVEGSQFTGTIPSDITPLGFLATYGGTMDESGWDYDLSQQDGTLNEEYVLMEAVMEGATLPTTIDFKHKTAILQPTFMGVNMGDVTQIVMSGVKNEISPLNNATGQITIRPTDAQNGIYVFLTMPHVNNETYISNHTFTFNVTDNQGKQYTGSLTIPDDGKRIEAGKLYTATIELTEVITYCNLPELDIFKNAILAALYNNSQLTKIEFKANSNEISGTQIGTCGAYLVPNTTTSTLEIHTSASVFVFPGICASMFNGTTFYEETQPLLRVTSIKFNDCIDTSKVTSMSNMFRGLSALKELDLICFNTSNVTVMNLMFAYCSKLEMLNLSSFDVSKVTNFTDMLWMMSNLENGEKTKVYVPDPNPFADKNTGINTNFRGQLVTPGYAEYVTGTPQ